MAKPTAIMINYSDRFGLTSMTGNLTSEQRSANNIAPITGPSREFECNVKLTAKGPEGDICTESDAIGGLSFSNSTTSTATLSVTITSRKPTTSTAVLLKSTQWTTAVTTVSTPAATSTSVTTSHQDIAKTSTQSAPPQAFIFGMVILGCAVFAISVGFVCYYRGRCCRKSKAIRKQSKQWHKVPLPHFGARELSAGPGVYERPELPASSHSLYELPSRNTSREVQREGNNVEKSQVPSSICETSPPSAERETGNITTQTNTRLNAQAALDQQDMLIQRSASPDLISAWMSQEPLAVPLSQFRQDGKLGSPPSSPLWIRKQRGEQAISNSDASGINRDSTPKLSIDLPSSSTVPSRTRHPMGWLGPLKRKKSKLPTNNHSNSEIAFSTENALIPPSPTTATPTPVSDNARKKGKTRVANILRSRSADPPTAPLSSQPNPDRGLGPASDIEPSSRKPQLSREFLASLPGANAPRNPNLTYASSASLASSSSSDSETSPALKGDYAPYTEASSTAGPSRPRLHDRPLSQQQLNQFAPSSPYQPRHPQPSSSTQNQRATPLTPEQLAELSGAFAPAPPPPPRPNLGHWPAPPLPPGELNRLAGAFAPPAERPLILQARNAQIGRGGRGYIGPVVAPVLDPREGSPVRGWRYG
ncbi:hypothetical protein B0J14DRAFT_277317 [Halenospora varia]|nr:hypothetical protein B0J14DRAFT_277317 [Halenospora varia]